ncbi:unnamed protein product [Mycena citricolor]|uniref:HAD-like protein n=1 Tax=Mycena citricolor TaxID=2018698 RepID=A0AAD2HUL5_9AGAR|nr:unnamed protein product [Mycena citricolor]
MAPQFDAVIFDIGDVLFTWSANTKTSISPKVLRQILSSPTWFNYERGKLTEEACYLQVGRDFSLAPDEIREALVQARASLQPNTELISLVRELKQQSNGRLSVFAMSNISLPDYAVLRSKDADWDIFDRIFTSGEAGERETPFIYRNFDSFYPGKPHLGFYRHVLDEANISARRTIFVDDKLENVLSARSLGLHGIVFPPEGSKSVQRALRNLLGDPVHRAQRYLLGNAGALLSVTNTGVTLKENFAQLLILELTGNHELIDIVEHPRAWNFFHAGEGQLTTTAFPFDLDTTSIGLTVIPRDEKTVKSVMDDMLQYIDSDGIVLTYFDHQRPRFDPVVCVNVLTLFYKYGRQAELKSTLVWVRDVLDNRAYLEGTRYYETAECFLYFLSRLLESSDDVELHVMMDSLFKERVQERIGVEGDVLQLGMRILACASAGIRDDVDMRTLLSMQMEDGGFDIGWIYKYGSSDIRIGNRGVSTALAISAIAAVKDLSPPVSPTQTVLETSAEPKTSRRLSLASLTRLSGPISSPPRLGPLYKLLHRLHRNPRSVQVGGV